MTNRVIEFRRQCADCKGTGLYVGLAERDGGAVVCCRCDGKGYVDARIEYEIFEQRLVREEVQRVYRVNPGICIGAGGGYKLEDFGGMPYADWQEGKDWPAGSEDRAHTCPAWFYQSADYSKKPNWKECWGCCAFSGCKHFENKSACWERWDCEHYAPAAPGEAVSDGS